MIIWSPIKPSRESRDPDHQSSFPILIDLFTFVREKKLYKIFTTNILTQ